MPPVKKRSPFFLPAEFWVRHVAELDRKLRELCERDDWGRLHVEFFTQGGKVDKIYNQDRTRATELEKILKKHYKELDKRDDA